jgi:hypothetical protein
VEDHVCAGLYLEMTDRAPDAYVRERALDVLALEGVARATWWRNVRPGRDDLPRHLPEFGLLAVYEVGAGFRPPLVPDDVACHHFLRTRRPGQGRLTGRPTTGLSLVLISPREPAQAQRLRDWGDFVHIRHIAAAGVPGMTMITPYQRAGGGDPRYLHLYEMDSEDPEATFKAMTPHVAQRLGGADSEAFRHWATCPELRIMYVNSFTRLGALTRADLSAGAPGS